MIGLPPADEIESLSHEYQSTLTLAYREERFFPALQFPFSGRIIGWKIAATDNVGGTHPIVTPWSFDGVDEYIKGEALDFSECVTSEIRLDNLTVFIHESGPPSPGVPFTRGDILSLFMRPENSANFVAYLYNGNFQSEVNASADGNFSYYRRVQSPRDATTKINQLQLRDQLLPLMSLELCKSLQPMHYVVLVLKMTTCS